MHLSKLQQLEFTLASNGAGQGFQSNQLQHARNIQRLEIAPDAWGSFTTELLHGHNSPTGVSDGRTQFATSSY